MPIGSSIGKVGGAGGATPSRASSGPAPGKKTGATRFIEVLREGVKPPSSPAAAAQSAPSTATRPARTEGPSAVKRLLQSTLDSEKKLDGILAAAGRGKTFSPQELISMQAEVFRYSQTVELVSRTADRVVGAVKQTLGTQV